MDSEKGKTYRCGTLTYTKAGVIAIFAWLLWGDFCFTLMEVVVPNVLPLKLYALGAPNWVMAVILSTIPSILNMTICPYVSFKSDRFRSKWGRRLPFITLTMPFLCISLALIGWSDTIAVFLKTHLVSLSAVAPATVAIALIAIFMVMFQFFNMFVASVFWYLFNDVVPAQFLARFVSSFRIIGSLAAATFNWFIFQYAESHMKEIMIGAALVYLAGFGLMCLFVREGEYPPVEAEDINESRGLGIIKVFFKECFVDKLYWFFFLHTSFGTVITVILVFNVFFYREMNLDLEKIGKFTAIVGIASMPALYFAAIFIDRWHPLRVNVQLRVFAVVTYVTSAVWIFVTLPGEIFFYLYMATSMLAVFQNAMLGVCDFPMYMRLLPKSRFGQFCSAQALLRSFCVMIGGILAGGFIDLMKYFHNGSNFAYRYISVWCGFFSIITAILGIYLYMHWQRLGGDEKYQPPAPWSPNGREDAEYVPFIKSQRKYLNIALNIFSTIMIISVTVVPFLLYMMYLKNTMAVFNWYLWIILPLSIIALALWKLVERGIRQDITRSLNNEKLKNGIPHHGVFLVVSTTFVLMLGVWIFQVIYTINMNMTINAIAFGFCNIVTNLLLVLAVWVLCRIECHGAG